jgi:hypothetical protein
MTMDCMEYRRAMLAEPSNDGPELRLHAASCAECAGYAERLRRFESRLERALRLDVNAQSTERRVVVPLHGARARGARPWDPPHRRWIAAAASLLLGTVVAVSLWLAAPGRSLAAAVVGHMAGEPNAWARTAVRVPEPQLDSVLTDAHLRLKAGAGLVSYANSCSFRGHTVPHLVVQTESGPVTVMVLTHEALRSPMRFNEHGYRGVILPVRGHGSLAVLERGPGVDISTVEEVAARVLRAVEWTA